MAMRSRDKDSFSSIVRGFMDEKAVQIDAFVGQMIDWQDESGVEPTVKRPFIHAAPIESLSSEMQHRYDNKAIMSMDGLLRPVSVDGSAGLPRYIKYSGQDDSNILFTQVEFMEAEYRENEYNEVSAVSVKFLHIGQDDIHPLTNPQTKQRNHVATDHSNTPEIGHDFEIVARTGEESGTPENGLLMPPVESGYSGVDYEDDYRFVGLRLPMVGCGWGYDTEGYPVPNESDTPGGIGSGIFTVENRTDKFFDEHLRRSDMWVTAPIDLRLDRQRGVWTAHTDQYWFGKVLDKFVEPDATGNIWIEYPLVPDHTGDNNYIQVVNDTHQGLFRDTRCFLRRDGEEFKIISTASDFRIWEGTALETISPGGSGEVEIYRPQPNDENVLYDGFTVTAFNFWTHNDQDIESGDKIRVYIDRGEWKILTGGSGGGSDVEVVSIDCTRYPESGFYYGWVQQWNPLCVPCLSGEPNPSGTPCPSGTEPDDEDSGTFSNKCTNSGCTTYEECRIVDLTEWFPIPTM